MNDVVSHALVGGAAFAGGLVNAIAGGGSLITFPTLVAAGLPSTVASLTNTVAMCPGYLGALVTQRRDLKGHGKRALGILPGGVLGGVAGALLLLNTHEGAFNVVVPFLLTFAVAMLAFQDQIRSWLFSRPHGKHGEYWAALPVSLAAIYGGYFGAGMGVIVLAALAIVLEDSIVRINALKQGVSLVVNVAAAVVFLISGRVEWSFAVVMAACSLCGGAVGGVIASRVSAKLLRWTVIVIGISVAAIYFAKLA